MSPAVDAVPDTGMEIGLGLPNAIPGTAGRTLLDWAREGEQAGFSCLATTDRMVYDSHESMTTLAAAAAVTGRCRLTSAILIAPLRCNTALLAKQAATVDQISGGRLVLGLAVGARPDDFVASGVEYAGRGAALDRQVVELRALWAGERSGGVGPAPSRQGGPELLFGGHSPAAIARAARWGEGWIAGSVGPEMFEAGAAAVREAWERAGRAGRPRLSAMLYVALGPDAEALAGGYVRDYYGFAPPYAEQILRSAAVGTDRLAAAVERFELAGCDELILLPCTDDLHQLELAAEAVRPASRRHPTAERHEADTTPSGRSSF